MDPMWGSPGKSGPPFFSPDGNVDFQNGDLFPEEITSDEVETASLEEFVVGPQETGVRLDVLVGKRLGLTRSYANKLVRKGEVGLSSGQTPKPSLKLAEGTRVEVHIRKIEPLDLEPEAVEFGVVYEDEDIIVIDKPAGLVVHPAPGHWTGTLVHGLLHRDPRIGLINRVLRPGIVHRLDSTTSGLMVVARNSEALDRLILSFKSRTVEKRYLALVWGSPKSDRGSIDQPIGRDPGNRLRMAVVEDGRPSRTDYRVLVRFREGFSLIECNLLTGRTHQIRVHLRHIGYPLVGDVLYAPRKHPPFPIDRVFLHSWQLTIPHPGDGRRISFRSTLPCQLCGILRNLRPEGRA
ncbi:MAG: RluA family pseudouridine synthase [Synergistales bacterium]